MIYIVYFTTKADDGAISTTALGMFMFKDDAEMFKREHTLCHHLVIMEVDDWEGWTAIRENAGLYMPSNI